MNHLTAHALGFSAPPPKQTAGGAIALEKVGKPTQPDAGTGDIVKHLHAAMSAHKKGDHKTARKHALNYANATVSQMSQAPGGAPTVPDAAGGVSAPTPGGV